MRKNKSGSPEAVTPHFGRRQPPRGSIDFFDVAGKMELTGSAGQSGKLYRRFRPAGYCARVVESIIHRQAAISHRKNVRETAVEPFRGRAVLRENFYASACDAPADFASKAHVRNAWSE